MDEVIKLKGLLRWFQLRLHKTHSINNNFEKCDYKSCMDAKVLMKGIQL